MPTRLSAAALITSTFFFSVSIFLLLPFRVDRDILRTTAPALKATHEQMVRVDQMQLKNHAYKQMTSQVAGGNLCVSFIRGYHGYKDMWEPALGDVLLLEREITNIKDKFAIAVMQGSTVVGHMPYNTAPAVSYFLKRSTNKAVVEGTGAAVNRGTGYGMEIPCKQILWDKRLH